jgi:hypothetical protein
LGAFFLVGIDEGLSRHWPCPQQQWHMLTLVIDTPIAISLLTLPIIFTNFFQYFGCENRIQIAKKYWLFGLAIMVSIFLTSLFIMSFPKSLISVSIGFAMVAFSLAKCLVQKFHLEKV